jgi:hypothetical protein
VRDVIGASCEYEYADVPESARLCGNLTLITMYGMHCIMIHLYILLVFGL